METCIALRTSAPSIQILLPKQFVVSLKKLRRYINLFVTVHNGRSEMTEQNAMQISKKRLFEQLLKIPGISKTFRRFLADQAQSVSAKEIVSLRVEETESLIEFGTLIQSRGYCNNLLTYA